MKKNGKLEAIIFDFKEALKFYATESHYVGNCYCLDPELRFDKGKRAQTVLKKHSLTLLELEGK